MKNTIKSIFIREEELNSMFENLKVLELASVLAGPDVGMFFAEQGAKVIKVENKLTNGDVTRQWKLGSENQENAVSAYYSSVNWNKQILFYDLTNYDDKNEVYELVKTADVIIVNFKPGDAEKLGMDYETLKSFNSKVIYGEINGYGEKSKRSAYDVVLQAETGFMSINGTNESGPIKLPIALIDVIAAHQLKEGLLMAMLKKEKTGLGSKVEVSLYDSALSSLKNQATNWLMNQQVPKPMGSLHPNISPYGETFTTKDNKQVVLAIGNNKQFNTLLKILDASHLINDQRFSSNQLRVKNRKALDNELQPLFLREIREELMKQFIQENVPVGALNSIDEVFENEDAKKLILEEKIEGIQTKRVKTSVFKIT